MREAGKKTRIAFGAILAGVLTAGPFLLDGEVITPGGEPAVRVAAAAVAAYTAWTVVAPRRSLRAGPDTDDRPREPEDLGPHHPGPAPRPPPDREDRTAQTPARRVSTIGVVGRPINLASSPGSARSSPSRVATSSPATNSTVPSSMPVPLSTARNPSSPRSR